MFKRFLLLMFALGLGSPLFAQEMPCNVPPFLAQKVPPNILVIMDNSGSMGWPAYADPSSDPYNPAPYNPNKTYYGYFVPNKVYRYDGNEWVPVVNAAPNYDDRWPGNVLNWIIMSRISVLKKVLVGGKAVARSTRGFANMLICEGGDWSQTLTISGVGTFGFEIYDGSPNRLYIYKWSGSRWNLIRSTQNRVAIDSTFSRGVIQKLGDKDADGQWDDDAPRFWLIHFNNQGNSQEMNAYGNTIDLRRTYNYYYDHDGGYVASYYQDNNAMSRFVNAIENCTPQTNTPLAECLLETARYFQQTTQLFYNNDFKTGNQWDPMGSDASERSTYWCRKTFVLLLTDGEATLDRDPVLANIIGDYDRDGKEPSQSGDPYTWNDRGNLFFTSHYLDDVAFWAHTNDLRGNIPGFQNLTLYGVYVFGSGHPVLKEACKKGGFIDYNGNGIPDLQREWDENGDGVPDTYFEAQEGDQIERAIMDAVLSILNRVGSATAVSVISQTQKGEGTMYQAFFQPSYNTPYGEVKWIGELVSYFVDKNGNLREDTDHDHRLTRNDYIIKFKLEGNETKAERWQADENDMPLYKVDEKNLWDLEVLWSAGRKLLDKDPSRRNIKAIVKQGNTYNLMDFTTTNRGTLKSYMVANSTSDAFVDSLINYTRGQDYTNPDWRPRIFASGGKTWKLSDIVYSTPTFVGKPTERYDLIYEDLSYREFYNRKKDRRNIVLVGANDGMLHAFNAGVFDSATRSINGLGKELGEELWSVIPMNLLPHLKWLKSPQYCHVYYVDLKPKVTDAKIFTPDNDHPQGWGTIAIVGMRFGGTPITVDDSTYRSSYFALDISNPDNPRVLWEFTDANLGYTISYPSVLRVVQGNDTSWFVVFGSGTNSTPTGATSNQQAYFYVLDLKTGQLKRKMAIPYPSNQTQGAFCGHPISVDVKLDYSVDVIYLPVTYIERQGNSYVEKGALYRIVTGNSTNPSNWQLSMVMNVDRPITSGSAASMDEYGNLWVFFGTGKYFTDDDEVDNSTHYFIGLKDPYWNGGWTSATSPSHDLSQRFLDATNIKVKLDSTGNATVEGFGPRALSFTAFVDFVNRAYSGWYVRLPNGEKSLNFPLVLGGAVLFTTYKVVNDPCGFGGQGWLYVLFYKTGTAAGNAPLGTNLQGYAYTKVQVEGMPSSPAVQIGATEQGTAFVQTSTGQVVQVQTEFPFNPKSGARIWRPANF